MKKIIVIEVIVLVLLLAFTAYAFFNLNGNPLPAEKPEESTPTQVEPQKKPDRPVKETEAPTEPPTEPPTEAPTEPPVVVEMEEGWYEVLPGHEMTSTKYFVYDLDKERFLYTTDRSDTTVYPASITKLFTAHVALLHISPHEKLTVGNEVLLIDPDSSVAKLMVGDVLTVEQLIAAMMLPSGNDATYVLTTKVGRILADDPNLDAREAMNLFVERMNEEALAQGMLRTHFVTPDGIHNEDHYMSLRDLVTASKLALANPIISRYAAMQERTVMVSEDRKLEWENTNLLLDETSDYYCPYTIGMKTGFTTPAGCCLISAFQVGERDILIGVFGSPDKEDRFADTLLLFAEAFGLEIPEPVDPEATTAPTETYADAA